MAVDTSLTPGTQENLSAGAPSQEGCWEEGVYSAGSDPILSTSSKECHRIVCGGNFWGKSAVDICCDTQEITEGDGAEQIRYRNCYQRRPLTKDSQETWMETRFYLKPPVIFFDGDLIPSEVLLEGFSSSSFLLDPLMDWLVPPIYAGPFLGEGITEWEWTKEERARTADSIYEVIHLIETKLNEGDPSKIGGPLTLQHDFVQQTLYTARYAAHLLNPIQYPCPTFLSELCNLVDPVFRIFWFEEESHGLFGRGGFAKEQNIIAVDRESKNSSRLSLATAVVHETQHTLYYYAKGGYGYTTSIIVEEKSFYIENELIAYLVGGAFEHFSLLVDKEFGDYWDLLKSNRFLPLASSLTPYILNFAFYELMPQENQQLIKRCVSKFFSDNPGFDSHNKSDFVGALVGCMPQALGFTDIFKLLQEVEVEISARGGLCTILPDSTEGVSYTPCKIRQVDQARNETAVPAKTGELKGYYEWNPVEGSPPSQDFDFQPPQQGWTDTVNIPNTCALEAEIGSYSLQCANWCWDHFPNGRDGGPCQEITRYDAEETNCTLSTTLRCWGGVSPTCSSHPDWYPKACEELCKQLPQLCEAQGNIEGGGQAGDGGAGGGTGDQGGGGGAIGYNSDVDGDSQPNNADTDDDNDGTPDISDADDDNDGIGDAQDYVPGNETFNPGSTNNGCVTVDQLGIETCWTSCVCDQQNPWWCQPAQGAAIGPCPGNENVWDPPGENRHTCNNYHVEHFEELQGNTIVCSNRGYCGNKWIWTMESSSLCQGSWYNSEGTLWNPTTGYESVGGCSYYYGPLTCYDGPQPGTNDSYCFANGANQACAAYCGCPTNGSVYVGCCIDPGLFSPSLPDGFIYYCQMVGGSCFCQNSYEYCLPPPG